LAKKTHKHCFNVGDLIVPQPPLKQSIGIVVQVVNLGDEEQDLEVLIQTENKRLWVSSLDVRLLKYQEANKEDL
tara:strand:- start:1591 stop:1812 length:222 start_codon:yes stop_codon:yes gene_type:complete